MTREEVIKGLEICTKNESFAECVSEECPFIGGSIDGNCIEMLMHNALALLKAQEPHILSIEEVKALSNGSVVWEETNHPECEPLQCGMICKDDGYAADIVFHGGQGFLDDITEMPEYFDGYKIRYWSAKPTEKQRKAVKWE